MKKKVSKMPLSKETLHALDYPAVVGGFSFNNITCTSCACTASVCQSCKVLSC